MNIVKLSAAILLFAAGLASCKKYKEFGDANYPDATVYLPAAVEGNSVNGIYLVNSVAVAGQKYRYVADVPNKKLNLPLSVYRSGLDKNAAVPVAIAVNTDTITKLIAALRLPAGTEILPADKYMLANSVTIETGKETADFALSVDLNFLLANLTKKYAVGVGISSSSKKNAAASTAVILIDPAFLIPTALFTTTISGRTVSFSNTSLNGVMFSWDYGDSKPVSTLRAAPYVYTAAGTYTIKLTVTGALGDLNKAVYSLPVVIL